MAIVCIVLGVWGIWDYVVAIPRAEMQSSRTSLISDVVQPALITEMGSVEREEATVILNERLANSDAMDTRWIGPLEIYRTALIGGGIEAQNEANELLEQEITLYGNVTPPSKFDRPMQWIFILCLPFGFYYLWKYAQMRKRARQYCLDDDGTLTTPEGIWKCGEIIDIDMSRWIAKTGNARLTWTAKAVVGDDEFVTLDDYIYRDMHLIIGALAHRFYPEEWTPLARMVKKVDDDQEDVESEEE